MGYVELFTTGKQNLMDQMNYIHDSTTQPREQQICQLQNHEPEFVQRIEANDESSDTRLPMFQSHQASRYGDMGPILYYQL